MCVFATSGFSYGKIIAYKQHSFYTSRCESSKGFFGKKLKIEKAGDFCFSLFGRLIGNGPVKSAFAF